MFNLTSLRWCWLGRSSLLSTSLAVRFWGRRGSTKLYEIWTLLRHHLNLNLLTEQGKIIVLCVSHFTESVDLPAGSLWAGFTQSKKEMWDCRLVRQGKMPVDLIKEDLGTGRETHQSFVQGSLSMLHEHQRMPGYEEVAA